MREVKTCDRCRHFKRRCDLLKPACTRCVQAGVRCSFDIAGSSAPGRASAGVAPSSVPAQQQYQHALAPTGMQLPPMHVGSTTQTSAPLSSSSSSRAGVSLATVPLIPVQGSAAGPSAPGAANAAAPTAPSSSIPRGQQDLAGSPTNGLISPSSESPEPDAVLTADTVPPVEVPVPSGSAAKGARIVRKRKRNCLSCLRCHRLKVKCDKELPCGRCKASGNGRECYYSYNKGPNGGKFPCPTAPVPSSKDEKKPQMATWQVQHRVRGSSHWRELMTKVRSLTHAVLRKPVGPSC